MAEEADREILETLEMARRFLRAQEEMGLPWLPRPEGGRQPASKADVLQAFYASFRDCRKCGLYAGRRQVVFGEGNPDAGVMFIGEAPGAEEDRQGVPFVGASGQLLSRMIEKIQLRREDVYIANVIKCRPPENRDPEPEEIACCEPYLKRQIEIVAPTVICTLGRFAAQTLLNTTEPMGRLRGRVFAYEGIKMVATYHPAALLYNPKWRYPAWEDLKLLRKEYDGLTL